MNCLLHFYEMPHNLYIYLEGIDCNETLYNTTIEGIQYDRDLSYWSNFTAKEDSTPCTIGYSSCNHDYFIIHYTSTIDPVVSSSSPLISSISTASVFSDLYISSTHLMSPTPSSKSMDFKKCIYIQILICHCLC